MRALMIVSLLLALFAMFVGCARVYRALGLEDEDVKAQTQADREVIVTVLEQGRETLWQIVSAAIALVGAVVSGLLGKWLSRERKTVTALIEGVEGAQENGVKQSIKAVATAAGVEAYLHRRVQALT